MLLYFFGGFFNAMPWLNKNARGSFHVARADVEIASLAAVVAWLCHQLPGRGA